MNEQHKEMLFIANQLLLNVSELQLERFCQLSHLFIRERLKWGTPLALQGESYNGIWILKKGELDVRIKVNFILSIKKNFIIGRLLSPWIVGEDKHLSQNKIYQHSTYVASDQAELYFVSRDNLDFLIEDEWRIKVNLIDKSKVKRQFEQDRINSVIQLPLNKNKTTTKQDTNEVSMKSLLYKSTNKIESTLKLIRSKEFEMSPKVRIVTKLSSFKPAQINNLVQNNINFMQNTPRKQDAQQYYQFYDFKRALFKLIQEADSPFITSSKQKQIKEQDHYGKLLQGLIQNKLRSKSQFTLTHRRSSPLLLNLSQIGIKKFPSLTSPLATDRPNINIHKHHLTVAKNRSKSISKFPLTKQARLIDDRLLLVNQRLIGKFET